MIWPVWISGSQSSSALFPAVGVCHGAPGRGQRLFDGAAPDRAPPLRACGRARSPWARGLWHRAMRRVPKLANIESCQVVCAHRAARMCGCALCVCGRTRGAVYWIAPGGPRPGARHPAARIAVLRRTHLRCLRGPGSGPNRRSVGCSFGCSSPASTGGRTGSKPQVSTPPDRCELTPGGLIIRRPWVRVPPAPQFESPGTALLTCEDTGLS